MQTLTCPRLTMLPRSCAARSNCWSAMVPVLREPLRRLVSACRVSACRVSKRDAVDLGELFRRERPAGRVDIVLDLLRRGRTRDHACHYRIAQKPAECQLQQRAAAGTDERLERRHDAPVARAHEFVGAAWVLR